MKYEKRVVVFIDILGFRNHINSTINSTINGDEDNEEAIQHLHNALMVIRDVMDLDKEPEERIAKSKVITQFSDSIVISHIVSEPSEILYTLLEIQWLVSNLAFKGILCRGAIAVGKLIHNDKIIFGPGLVKAYEAETRAAMYPRVILHDSVISECSNAGAFVNDADSNIEFFHGVASPDEDGMFYIDYFEKCRYEFDYPDYDFPRYIQKLKEIIEIGLKSDRYDMLVKYGWLKTKFNDEIVETHTKADALDYYKKEDSVLYNFYKNLKPIE